MEASDGGGSSDGTSKLRQTYDVGGLRARMLSDAHQALEGIIIIDSSLANTLRCFLRCHANALRPGGQSPGGADMAA